MSSSRVLTFSGRAIFIQLVFVLGLILLISRLIYLQIYQDTFLDKKVIKRSHAEYSLLASRGKIFDRNENILAFDVKSYSLGVDIKKLASNLNKIPLLAESINKSEKYITDLVLTRKKGYRELQRHVDMVTKEAIENQDISGVYFSQNLRRSYPQKEVSSHVVGITDNDRNGLQGTEYVFNKHLSGTKGKFIGIKGSGNRKIDGKRTDARSGKDIYLTIDIRLQTIAFEALRRSVIENNASSGSIIITDPKNSQILALVNYPSFDPSDRNNIRPSVLRNRATIDVFEPGSVLKPIAMAAIIDSKKVNKGTLIDTSPGWIELAGYKTRDFKNYGLLSLSNIISNSSNVGMVKLCLDQETPYLTSYYKNFGIGQHPSNIIIPSREGFLMNHTEFTIRDKVSSCYGYGLSMSALQIAQAYSVFANKGIYKELSLFLDEDFSSSLIEKRVLSAETTNKIREMLIETVSSKNGTAKNAQIAGTEVAGKTGTAINTSESENSYTVTFAGFAPAKDPHLLSVVVLHGLRGDNKSGGQIAAPIFSDVISQSLHVLEAGI